MDHRQLHETLSMSTEDGQKIQIINVVQAKSAKSKKMSTTTTAKSAFDPSIIPDDVTLNTMNIDHGYFLSFMPQHKSKMQAFDEYHKIIPLILCQECLAEQAFRNCHQYLITLCGT